MVNSVVIVGRVGQPPEMKYFDSGKAKATFSIAVNRWNPKNKEEVTDWFNVEFWDKQAETAGEWVKKGTLIVVEGRLAVSKWTSPDGESLERYLIRGTNFRLLGSKRDEN